MGVVAPNEEHLTAWAKANGRSESFKELCADHVRILEGGEGSVNTVQR